MCLHHKNIPKRSKTARIFISLHLVINLSIDFTKCVAKFFSTYCLYFHSLFSMLILFIAFYVIAQLFSTEIFFPSFNVFMESTICMGFFALINVKAENVCTATTFQVFDCEGICVYSLILIRISKWNV